MFRYLIISLSLVISTSAQCQTNPSTYSFTYGNLKGLVVNDGFIQFAGNPFDVPQEAVNRSLIANFRSQEEPLAIQINTLVLDTPVGRVLADSGGFNIFEFPDPNFFAKAGNLHEALETAGVSRDSIELITLTHCHGDHVSGMILEDGTMAFPNATVHVNRDDHLFWFNHPSSPPAPNLRQDPIVRGKFLVSHRIRYFFCQAAITDYVT